MKKFIVKLGVFCILLFVAPSCNEFIDVVPDNIAVIEEAFDTRNAAERFLATLYGYLPNYGSVFQNPALTAGDEIAVNLGVSRDWPGRIIGIGGQNVGRPLMGHWGNQGTISNMFIALRDCNIFLDNLDRPFDLQDFEKKRWIAEAKFLKAYYHFYLMRMYGPIPIIRENMEVSEGQDVVRVSRDPVDEVADYIVALLDEAIVDLPETIEQTNEFGRVSKPVAAAIKARTLMTVASPLFNGNTDYASFNNNDGEPLISQSMDPDKWIRAAEACKEAIDWAEQTGHTLYEFAGAPDSWSDSTILKLSIRGSVTEPWNNEVIWGLASSPVATLQVWSQPRINPGLNFETGESVLQYYSSSFRVAEMFYSENGVPIEEDLNYDYANRDKTDIAGDDHRYYIRAGFETARLNMNREPRFHASLIFDGGIMMGNGVTEDEDAYSLSAKGGERGGLSIGVRYPLTGYLPKKLVYYTNSQSTGAVRYSLTNYPFPVVRLADLYLLYAEALNEANGPAQAYEWIDKVRRRAGLKGVVESWNASSNRPNKPATTEGFREIVQQERMIELVFEGQRFWDLRRWKRAVEFLNSDIRSWNVSGETTQDYYNVITVGRYSFLSRDYLWPIAQFDIVRNSNLVQNPGW